LSITKVIFFDEKRPVHLGFSFGYLDHPYPSQWFIPHENVAFATPLVFIVLPSRLAQLSRNNTASSLHQSIGVVTRPYIAPGTVHHKVFYRHLSSTCSI
jgi:Gpi18-like mannosyltransferase